MNNHYHGHYQRAIEDYNEAFRLKQDYAIACNRRFAYLKQVNKNWTVEMWEKPVHWWAKGKGYRC